MASVYFPPNTIKLLGNLGLSESDVLDVFHKGEYKKTASGGHTMVRKYPSYKYEIGLIYIIDNDRGDYVITYVWKRDRR